METLPLPCHPACPSLPRNRSEAKRRDLRYYRTHRGKEAKPTCPDISPARKGWEIGGYGPGTWLTLQLSPKPFLRANGVNMLAAAAVRMLESRAFGDLWRKT